MKPVIAVPFISPQSFITFLGKFNIIIIQLNFSIFSFGDPDDLFHQLS